MKAIYFYNKKEYGDILFICLNDLSITSSVTKDDVVLNYKKDILVMIEIHEMSELVKIKAEGRIYLPSNLLIDIINNHLASLNIEKLDYVESSGFVVGKIIEIKNNALNMKRFKICKVDIGNEIIQIISGATNLKEGLNVVVATLGTMMNDGTIVPPRILFLHTSYGVICSPKQLGLEIDYPEDHVLELEDDAQIGQDFFSIKQM